MLASLPSIAEARHDPRRFDRIGVAVLNLDGPGVERGARAADARSSARRIARPSVDRIGVAHGRTALRRVERAASSMAPAEQAGAADTPPRMVTAVAATPSIFRTLGVEILSRTRLRRSRWAGRAPRPHRRESPRGRFLEPPTPSDGRSRSPASRPRARRPPSSASRPTRTWAASSRIRAAARLRAVRAAFISRSSRSSRAHPDRCRPPWARCARRSGARIGRRDRQDRDGTHGARRTVPGHARVRPHGDRPRRDHSFSRWRVSTASSRTSSPIARARSACGCRSAPPPARSSAWCRWTGIVPCSTGSCSVCRSPHRPGDRARISELDVAIVDPWILVVTPIPLVGAAFSPATCSPAAPRRSIPMWRCGEEAIGRFLPRPAKTYSEPVGADGDRLSKKAYAEAGRSSERKPRRKSASEHPSSRTSTSRAFHADWQPPRRRGADGSEAIGLRLLLVHAGEPERHQRVRAAGRTDVRATRQVRRGGREEGSRGDGARAVTRAAAA